VEPPAEAVAAFGDVERVIADSFRFKMRLGIGEDAYASLWLKNGLQQIWDIGGVAVTGGTVAASPFIASTFFASTASGGFLSLIGLGTAAATPIGWVVAAALMTGGTYYGVTRLVRRYSSACIDTIPKFINTPMDVLGTTLFDLIATLAVRVAEIDENFDDREKCVIFEYFVTEWGMIRNSSVLHWTSF